MFMTTAKKPKFSRILPKLSGESLGDEIDIRKFVYLQVSESA